MLITIQHRNIWFTDSGGGSPVIVLLHGYLESSAVWNGFSEKLSARFRVISVDLPGHGQSEVHGKTQSMEMMAGVIRELLDELKIRKVLLTGHSLGGYVTLAFLGLYPEYLSGYCLFHSHPLADTPETIEKRKREITIVEAGKKDLMYPDSIEKMFAPRNLDQVPELVKRSKKIASQIPGEGIIAVLNGMIQRPSRAGVMEEGRVPCLWILGAHDSYVPFDTIREKVRLPANASVEVLYGSGHLGFIEEEDLSVKIVTDFAEKLA
jgi:pimeloyl-ACP methyl ester carboxylesterase